jgi:hypothetical protein
MGPSLVRQLAARRTDLAILTGFSNPPGFLARLEILAGKLLK